MRVQIKKKLSQRIFNIKFHSYTLSTPPQVTYRLLVPTRMTGVSGNSEGRDSWLLRAPARVSCSSWGPRGSQPCQRNASCGLDSCEEAQGGGTARPPVGEAAAGTCPHIPTLPVPSCWPSKARVNKAHSVRRARQRLRPVRGHLSGQQNTRQEL